MPGTSLLREILGLSSVRGMGEKWFHHKTLLQDVDLVLREINALVAQAGRGVFKRRAGCLARASAMKYAG